ncbi:hypothetical protein [Rhizobium mayense]|uniref:Uncharacterized protein n=1 Tax=Rhizobium mayense TaxID=1312184 RepID=A0ABT7K4B7_9HYPH|nr:hypothetical protein [Rhizobium mayense]MDL2403346.1 hypothetical protein [Rhizobium mayense]
MRQLAIIMAAIAFCMGPSAAADLAVSPGQWSIAYTASQGGYCAFVWDSGLGQKVEFRKGFKSIAWIISDAAWNLPQASQGKIGIVAHNATWQVTAKALTPTSVMLSDADTARGILSGAMSGSADIELDFPGTEPNWIVPISRIYPMHSAFGQCLSQLGKSDPEKPGGGSLAPF